MNIPSHRQPPKPKSNLAVIAFVAAVIAVSLIVIGTLIPGGELQVPVVRQVVDSSWTIVYVVIYIVPAAVGLFAALLGGKAIRQIEKSGDRLEGDGLAVFAIMAGLFALILGLVDTFALLW